MTIYNRLRTTEKVAVDIIDNAIRCRFAKPLDRFQNIGSLTELEWNTALDRIEVICRRITVSRFHG